MENVEKGVLMTDGHVGYVMPTGGLASAVMLDMKSEEIGSDFDNVFDWIQNNISFGIGRKNKNKVDHEIFDVRDPWLAYE